MTISRCDAIWLGFATFFLAEGTLLIFTGKGLIEHALPGKLGDGGRRRITAAAYFLMSGLLLFFCWRGE